mmetsp:Transcript_9916/g.21409  ORF Transcript_9916/g.21409 Transcript_9916/m.21409 type:complete len:275 (-) Transcript_9916:58-882(-)
MPLRHEHVVRVHPPLVFLDLTRRDALEPVLLRQDSLPNGQLRRTRAYLRDVGAAEPVRRPGEDLDVHARFDGRLPQRRLENRYAALEVGQGDVYQLVETSRPDHGGVDDVRPVGGADDEDVLPGAHAVDLGQDLVDDTVARLARAGSAAPSRLRDGVHLVEHEYTRTGRAGLVEELSDVGLALSEPLRQELGTLDADEVGTALVRDGLGQERLTAAGRAVEEHALGRVHPELDVLVGVLDGVLDRLVELALDVLETADVLPVYVGDLDSALSKR